MKYRVSTPSAGRTVCRVTLEARLHTGHACNYSPANVVPYWRIWLSYVNWMFASLENFVDIVKHHGTATTYGNVQCISRSELANACSNYVHNTCVYVSVVGNG